MSYILRLDDASEYMDQEKWARMETLLDQYNIKPIYGVIPNNEDPELLKYERIENFWEWMLSWKDKGWTPALHGYNHVYETEEGGINPVNFRSEFAGVSYERQCQKLGEGVRILQQHGINPEIFFAPSHTFDENTLRALEQETKIRIISDTIADDVYYRWNFYFIPQQSGRVRKLPFKTVTFCYHPNTMDDMSFAQLEEFLSEHQAKFTGFSKQMLKKRKITIKDILLKKMYFVRRK